MISISKIDLCCVYISLCLLKVLLKSSVEKLGFMFVRRFFFYIFTLCVCDSYGAYFSIKIYSFICKYFSRSREEDERCVSVCVCVSKSICWS